MKRKGVVVLIIIMLVLSPVYCNASVSSKADEVTITQLAESFDHIFIANVTQKSIGTDHTYYDFHITEYLTSPLNTTELYMLVPGGSEIGVSPSTTFYLGVEYVLFCNEINEDYRILGNQYQYRLLDSVDVEELRNTVRGLLALKAASTNCTVASTALEQDNTIEASNPESVKNTRGEANLILDRVFLCFAGIFLVLFLVIKKWFNQEL